LDQHLCQFDERMSTIADVGGNIAMMSCFGEQLKACKTKQNKF